MSAIEPTLPPLRYSAKLLFQFRVMIGADPGIMRTCEERVVVFHATGPRKALAEAKRRGRKTVLAMFARTLNGGAEKTARLLEFVPGRNETLSLGATTLALNSGGAAHVRTAAR